MRYTRVFCRSYDLETGTNVIAWFYIIIYFINCFVNIFITDIVKSYANDVDAGIDYNDNNLIGFHYVCLVFGILTIILASTTLIKFTNQSETVLRFVVKWNVLRCFLVFIGILFAAVAFDHIFTVFLSCIVLVVDFCVSTYFTGVIASYLEVLSNPDIQESADQTGSIQLISHTRTLPQEKTAGSVDKPSSAKVDIEMGKDSNGTKLQEQRVKSEENNERTGPSNWARMLGVNSVSEGDAGSKEDGGGHSGSRDDGGDLGVTNVAVEGDEQLTPRMVVGEQGGSVEVEKKTSTAAECELVEKDLVRDKEGSVQDKEGSVGDNEGFVTDKEVEGEKGSTEDENGPEDKGSVGDEDSFADKMGSVEDKEGLNAC